MILYDLCFRSLSRFNPIMATVTPPAGQLHPRRLCRGQGGRQGALPGCFRILTQNQWIIGLGLGKIYRNPLFWGKIRGFRWRFSLKPIHWQKDWRNARSDLLQVTGSNVFKLFIARNLRLLEPHERSVVPRHLPKLKLQTWVQRLEFGFQWLFSNEDDGIWWNI